MAKKFDPSIKFTPAPDHGDESGPTLPLVRPARGLDGAEPVPAEVGCFRTRDDKVVCGVVLAPGEPRSNELGKALAPDSHPTIPVRKDAGDHGARVCREVVIDTINVHTVPKDSDAD
jgi:hypothetical protein